MMGEWESEMVIGVGNYLFSLSVHPCRTRGRLWQRTIGRAG